MPAIILDVSQNKAAIYDISVNKFLIQYKRQVKIKLIS